jgi:hypothetical protein
LVRVQIDFFLLPTLAFYRKRTTTIPQTMAKLFVALALFALCVAVAQAATTISTYSDSGCTTRTGFYSVRWIGFSNFTHFPIRPTPHVATKSVLFKEVATNT